MKFSLITLVLAASISATYIPPQINGTSTPSYPVYTPTPTPLLPSPISVSTPTIASPSTSPSKPTPVYPIHTPETSAHYPTGTGSWKPSGSGTGAPSAPTYIPPFTGGAAMPTGMGGKALGVLVGGVLMML